MKGLLVILLAIAAAFPASKYHVPWPLYAVAVAFIVPAALRRRS